MVKAMAADNIQWHHPGTVHVLRFRHDHDEVLLPVTASLDPVLTTGRNIHTAFIGVHTRVFDLATAVNRINGGVSTATVNKQAILINGEMRTGRISIKDDFFFGFPQGLFRRKLVQFLGIAYQCLQFLVTRFAIDCHMKSPFSLKRGEGDSKGKKRTG